MTEYKVLFSGIKEPLEFRSLLDALTWVKNCGALDNFLIKEGDGNWEDGTELFRNMQRLFGAEEE